MKIYQTPMATLHPLQIEDILTISNPNVLEMPEFDFANIFSEPSNS